MIKREEEYNSKLLEGFTAESDETSGESSMLSEDREYFRKQKLLNEPDNDLDDSEFSVRRDSLDPDVLP